MNNDPKEKDCAFYGECLNSLGCLNQIIDNWYIFFKYPIGYDIKSGRMWNRERKEEKNYYFSKSPGILTFFISFKYFSESSEATFSPSFR